MLYLVIHDDIIIDKRNVMFHHILTTSVGQQTKVLAGKYFLNIDDIQHTLMAFGQFDSREWGLFWESSNTFSLRPFITA